MRRFVFSLLCLIIGPSLTLADKFFQQRIAPILKFRCLKCHNAERSRGDLDLSSRQSLLKSKAIVPGKPAQSPLLKLIQGKEPEMPRNDKPLTKQQVADIQQWIQDGAPWPRNVTLKATRELWWSLRPLARPQIPSDTKYQSHNPIDCFVQKKLNDIGLPSSPEASRATLIRRLYYDLHGLPPSPEDIEQFVNDKSPDAYERLVDRLLASPSYGERWARHWLDVVHYGETHGYDKDKKRNHSWPYRDYVIRAFNDDKPYSRFVQEQLAGDVLFPNHADGIVATGFIAAGPWDFVGHVELREGTVEKKKTRLLDRDDMVSNTMSTFVSMTVHCARCHDHKFDPIPQSDYYRLQAVFAGVNRGDREYVSAKSLAYRQQLTQRLQQLESRWKQLEQRLADVSSPRLKAVNLELQRATKALAATPRPIGNKPSRTNGWHSGISRRQNIVKWVQVDLGRSMPIEQVRLFPARPVDFPDTPGFGFPVRFRITTSDDADHASYRVLADHLESDYTNPGDNPVSFSAKGVSARYVRVTAEKLWERRKDYVFALGEMQVIAQNLRDAEIVKVTSLDSIEAGRWSRKYLNDGFDSRRELPNLNDPKIFANWKKRAELETRIQQLQGEQRQLKQSLLTTKELKALSSTKKELASVRAQFQSLPKSKVYSVLPQTPRAIHRLHRGEVQQPKERMTPGALSCVAKLEAQFSLKNAEREGARRVALAQWITDKNNVLTWRSIANRIWHYHFGQGLVLTPNDFGENGGKPSHPQLLDWLACELRDNGGSLKQLHRLIVTSATYRQQSTHNPEAAKVDSGNRLLWRMNRRRLDAESIRDTVLSVSGQLNLNMGGPSFALFRFKDDHSPVYDYTDLNRIHDPSTYRRTIYRHIVRSVPNPFLECLDCADPNANVPVRNTTLTALQALALLNNPFMVRQSEHFAKRLKVFSSDPEKQIQRAYLLSFGRLPRSQEQATLLKYAKKHGLSNLCRVLLNANELVFVD